ncbi:BREX system ATP-binding domain-containing protein [Salinispora arenicola]|uniref:BREX system ATP-binding domain-containing protein n=1 Tax=Salinispora arenicola TaxID=168697 RepID=UPI0027DBBF80|nr:BREX system ATP-binding domain-containing protein [Salinispora arenicola]
MIRDLYRDGSTVPDRITAKVDDAYLDLLAQAITGQLGGKVGVAPRIYLRKLVADVLDRVEEFDDFDPRQHYVLTLDTGELTEDESAATSANRVSLDLP